MKNIFKYFGYGALSLVVVAVLFAANLVLQPYDTLRIYFSLGPEVKVAYQRWCDLPRFK